MQIHNLCISFTHAVIILTPDWPICQSGLQDGLEKFEAGLLIGALVCKIDLLLELAICATEVLFLF